MIHGWSGREKEVAGRQRLCTPFQNAAVIVIDRVIVMIYSHVQRDEHRDDL